jgi:hypothetical protein
MEKMTAEKTATMKNQLNDIALDISWAKIAQKYFGKSTGWLYHKLDGRDSHGNILEFTSSEKRELREALLDLSSRIAIAAKNIV